MYQFKRNFFPGYCIAAYTEPANSEEKCDVGFGCEEALRDVEIGPC